MGLRRLLANVEGGDVESSESSESKGKGSPQAYLQKKLKTAASSNKYGGKPDNDWSANGILQMNEGKVAVMAAKVKEEQEYFLHLHPESQLDSGAHVAPASSTT